MDINTLKRVNELFYAGSLITNDGSRIEREIMTPKNACYKKKKNKRRISPFDSKNISTDAREGDLLKVSFGVMPSFINMKAAEKNINSNRSKSGVGNQFYE